jgi:RNA polymerase sigma-70 factor (ECF subfamily)
MKRELVEAFQKGENWAFNEIYGRFLKPILHYVRLRVSDEHVAQELTQDIFLKVFRFSGSYRSGFAFTTWLWTIAKNTVVDFKKLNSNQVLASGAMFPEEIPATGPNAQEILEEKSKRKLLFRLTRSLSPTQKRVLWLRLVYQLPHQEIARRLGMTVAGVKTLVHRSKISLQELGLSAAMAEWA